MLFKSAGASAKPNVTVHLYSLSGDVVVVLGRSLWVAVSLKRKKDTVDAQKEEGHGTLATERSQCSTRRNSRTTKWMRTKNKNRCTKV